MTADKLCLTLVLLVSLGLVACGGDSSDRLAEEEIDQSDAGSSDNDDSSDSDDPGDGDSSSDDGEIG